MKNDRQKVKYALVGFGGIAINRIVKEGFGCDFVRVGKPDNAELIGVTDTIPERENDANILGLKWYGHLDKILTDPAVDAVFIATNNQSHAPLALAALEAGKHVLVEKPLAVNSREAKKLVELA
ncbi:MAG: Gfo/Idh/MocA family oxidoreductase, partial [Planctomycetaceae bacterium]|nr:Gfo/Idh/MocA family oxidoreductase [Planctomycetaceae bacterium]